MRTQVKAAQLQDSAKGRNTVLGIYVILTTFLIASYTLIQYFSM